MRGADANQPAVHTVTQELRLYYHEMCQLHGGHYYEVHKHLLLPHTVN